MANNKDKKLKIKYQIYRCSASLFNFFGIEQKEKGIALLITFLIMGIGISIVLGVSAISLSEIKMMRGMGDSVKAFYAADSGIEKTIYYDRKQIPEEGKRGLCDICTSCVSTDCQNCTTIGQNCDVSNCSNCLIIYSSSFNGKEYDISAVITSYEGNSVTTIKSYGNYEKTTRAIELNFSSVGTGSEAPEIVAASVVPQSVPEGTLLNISANISDSDDIDDATTFAHIQSPDEVDFTNPPGLVLLTHPQGSQIYSCQWTGPVGVYYVDITACDTKGNCSEAENI